MHKIKEQREKDKTNNIFSEEDYIFIRNTIKYLSRNVEQNISKNTNTNNKKKIIVNYFPTQSRKLFQSISELIISFKERSYEENGDGPITKNDKNPVK